MHLSNAFAVESQVMKKISLVILTVIGSALAYADTGFYQTLVTDTSHVIPHNYAITGFTGGDKSVHDTTGSADWAFFGTATFTWSKTNTSNTTYVGYKVRTHAAVPTYPASSDFDNPATVTYLAEQGGGGGGQ